MMDENLKIFIISGEASGDSNGAELVKSVLSQNNSIVFHGIGGSELKNCGVNLIHDYSKINFIGFSNVLKNYSGIKKVFNSTVEYVKKFIPDVIILIDFPGFNLKFAETINKFYKGRIVYYISPQIWAWHKKRIEKIRKYIDRMMVIFPFEVNFYKNLNYEVDYVGHPLVKKIDNFLQLNKKSASSNLTVTLLPGSRIEEINRMFPILVNVSEKIRSTFNADINLIYPDYINPLVYKNILQGRPCRLIPNKNHLDTLLNSDLVITKFGTTTLELALLRVPFVSVYKAGLSNYFIAKILSEIKYVSMPNILTDRKIVQEYIQFQMTTENIFSESERILTNTEYRNRIIEGFNEMKNIFLNTPVNKSGAEIIIEELIKSRN